MFVTWANSPTRGPRCWNRTFQSASKSSSVLLSPVPPPSLQSTTNSSRDFHGQCKDKLPDIAIVFILRQARLVYMYCFDHQVCRIDNVFHCHRHHHSKHLSQTYIMMSRWAKDVLLSLLRFRGEMTVTVESRWRLPHTPRDGLLTTYEVQMSREESSSFSCALLWLALTLPPWLDSV